MEDLKDIKDNISMLLEETNRKQALRILGEILDEDYDLSVASNIVKADCEPDLNKRMFEECFYSEGNEGAGHIKLKDILNAVEEIVNLIITQVKISVLSISLDQKQKKNPKMKDAMMVSNGGQETKA